MPPGVAAGTRAAVCTGLRALEPEPLPTDRATRCQLASAGGIRLVSLRLYPRPGQPRYLYRMEPTLEVFRDSRRVFASTGRWLHPLFELEEFLPGSGLNPARLLIRDKIVGRAAALLIVRLGFRRLHARLLSRLGLEVLSRHLLDVVWDELVERIDCQTEAALAEVDDLEEAYLWLRGRVQAVTGR